MSKEILDDVASEKKIAGLSNIKGLVINNYNVMLPTIFIGFD